MSADTVSTALISAPLAWTIGGSTLIGLGLGLRVIYLRLTLKVGIGDGGHRVMKRAIRAHANFAEWVPLTLLCLLAAELRGVDETVIAGLGAVLVVCRAMHGLGLSRHIGVSVMRTGGMTLNLLVLLAAAALAMVG